MKPLLCLSILVALSLAAPAQDPDRRDRNRFDGTWDTILSCNNSSGAQGFSFRFPSIVKDGKLHAEKGTKGQAGWLEISGDIPPDGKTRLYADGLVGASEFAVGGRPAGTEYGYHIDATFDDKHGTGKRVEGRPCDVTFDRQRK